MAEYAVLLSAKKMGAGNTIARIRNPEYFLSWIFSGRAGTVHAY